MMNVSVCAVLCLCIAIAWGMSEEMQEILDMLHNNCKDNSGVEEDLIKEAQKGNFNMNDEKLQCYAFCLMSEMSVISEDGVVDPDAVLAAMPEDIKEAVTPTIKKCGSPSGATPCEIALLAFKCYFEGDPKRFFFP